MPTINQVVHSNNNNEDSNYEKVRNALTQYIVAEINDNNCLGLTEDEINGMAGELVNSNTRAEVYNWCTTLMMGEPFAAELIKRRTETGPPFAGETLTSTIPLISEPVSAAALAPSPLPERESKNKAIKIGGGGGKQLSMRASRNAVQTNKNKNVRKPQSSTSHNKSPFTQTFNSNNNMASTLKQGKSECGCFGTVHNVRMNCANCGRIICEQENDKWCYYCGLEPSRCLAYEIAVEEGKVSAAAMAQNEEQYNTAIAQRDKLLEYAMHRAKRTTVIDDQAASLFDAQNAWLSPEERKIAQKDAARVEQEARIKVLQQHRGAFTVQLQLMGQTVPSAVSKGHPVQIKLSMADDKMKRATNNEEEEEECCESEPEKEVLVDDTAGDASKACKTNERSDRECANDTLKNNNENDEMKHKLELLEENEQDEDEDDEVKIDERVIEAGAAPLPTLLQSIWYNPDNGNDKRSIRSNHNNNNNHHYFTFTENTPHGMKAEQPISSASVDTHKHVRRYDELSRRVQQNYFEDDMNTYKEEKTASKHNEAIIGLVRDETSVANSKSVNKRNALSELAMHTTNDENNEIDGSNALQKVVTSEKVATSFPLVEEVIDKRFAAFVPTMQMRNRDDGICLSMHQP